MTPRERLIAAVEYARMKLKQQRHHAQRRDSNAVALGMPALCAMIAKRSGLYLDFDDVRYNYSDSDVVRVRVYEGAKTMRPLAILRVIRDADRRPGDLAVAEPEASDSAPSKLNRSGRFRPENADVWLRSDSMFGAW